MNSKLFRIFVWINFLSSAYHLLDTAFGVHSPVWPSIHIDTTLNAIGLFVFGTIALYCKDA